MNVQAINFTHKYYYSQPTKTSQNPADEVISQVEARQIASIEEVASLNLKADNIQKSAKNVQNAAKFAYDEGKCYVWNAVQYQKQAQEIFAKIQERIEELEFEGKNISDYESVILSLDDKDSLLEVVLKDGKATAYCADSLLWTSFDKYEIDLKTGELLTFKKDYKPYKNNTSLETGYTYVADVMSTQYEASEEYVFAGEKLVTCDLGVSNKDYKKSNKRFVFSNDELASAMFGVEEKSGANTKLNAERRFSYLKNDKLLAYYRNYELQSRLGTRSADIVYEFNNGEELGAFTKGYEQNSISNWSSKEVFKFNQEQIKEVVYGERKNIYSSTFQKKYEFEDDKVFVERN